MFLYFYCSDWMYLYLFFFFFFFFNDTATTEIYTLSLHDALPIPRCGSATPARGLRTSSPFRACTSRSEEHTSELQSLRHLVCRLLLEKKKKKQSKHYCHKHNNKKSTASNTPHVTKPHEHET